MPHVPDLSVKGWISTAEEKADKLLAHFYAAEKSQSNLFPNDVHSFPYILQKNLNNPLGLETELASELKAYFGKYFDSVAVTVKVRDETEGSSRQYVEFSISYSQDGKSYDLVDIKHLDNSLFERYYHYNNTGELKELDNE